MNAVPVTVPAEVAPTMADWAALVDRLPGCVACPELAAGRTQVVPGQFPPGAELLLLGEAPGANEDRLGVPFVGRSGHHLDFVMAEAGIVRNTVAVLNVLKCRPPENRAPNRVETANCRPWLERQIDLIDPLIVVTLGLTATEWALGRGTTLSAVRGHLHLFGTRPLLPTYHPAAAIRVGRTGRPAQLLDEDIRFVARLLPELRARRQAS
jgi:uracil-DNA glycosylase family 4